MVFVAKVKGCWYVYRSYRLPGHEYPFHEYLGPADTYPGGLKMVARKLAALEEKAERKKNSANRLLAKTTKLDYEGESEQ